MTEVEQLTFGMRRAITAGFPETVARVKDALKEQGFGVLTEIDVQATLKEKLGAEMPPYLILGACNPPLAHRALTADPEIGMLLPCNVVVRGAGGGVIIEAMDPVAAMNIVANPDVIAVAEEAKARLQRALETLE